MNYSKRIKAPKASTDLAHTTPSISLDQIHSMRKELAIEYRNEETYWYKKVGISG